MTKRQPAAPAKTVTAQEAARLVKSGMWVDYGLCLAQPDDFDKALAERVTELHDLKIRNIISMRPVAAIDADPEGEHAYLINLHFSGWDRRKGEIGRASYMPLNLGEVNDYYRRFTHAPDIVVVRSPPMDSDGFFNFSAANLWHREMVEAAKCVIVETAVGQPYVYGVRNGVHISEVDYVIQAKDAPSPQLPNPAPNDVDRAVARLIAGQVNDRDCLQIGIGAMPNAVCALLLETGQKELGVHTEMMVDGIADLYHAGRISGAHKQLDPGKIAYTFALGSQKLYDTLDHNHDLICYPTDYTNMPHVIMQNRNVVSINNTTQIDLQGQAASESDGFRHISGTGGQLQFVRGAYASPGGRSFICLSSTYTKRGAPRSRIVLNLTPGNIVTTPRSDVMYVVTEYGMVNLKGKSVPERAKALIGIAHPDFREELERQAYEHRIIPRGFTF